VAALEPAFAKGNAPGAARFLRHRQIKTRRKHRVETARQAGKQALTLAADMLQV
jgi:hypothetical protein